MRRPALRAALASLAGAAWLAARAAAAEESADTAENFAWHGQSTYVEQDTGAFRAPYRGTNSLSPSAGAETVDVTLYLGLRPWSGGELWLDPEIDQGRGLDDTLGVAGFPSGEAYKIGHNQPYFRLPRIFVRETVDLGGDAEQVGADANQLAGVRTADRLVLWIGKFSVADVFDTNRYAHDPRADFLNWSIIDTGTFDYAADAWGYTVGAALEWYRGAWAVRAGLFDLSNVPNSAHLEPGLHEYQWDGELEHRQDLWGRPGRVLVTFFDSHGRMGLLDQAVAQAAATGNPVDIAGVRAMRDRAGIGLNLEQQIADDLGAFARAGRAAGNVEAYEFTDMDRTVAAGLSLHGVRWRRTDDALGVAMAVNGISAARQRYLNAGGLGILVGDGRLPHPGPERIVESYYSLAVLRGATLSFDYQWIDNPAYNRDRGPVSVFAVRLHAQF